MEPATIIAGASVVTGAISSFFGNKAANKQINQAQVQYEQQQVFIKELLKEAKGDRKLADSLAQGTLDFNNAKVRQIWQNTTDSINAKYPELKQLFEKQYGPDGAIRKMTESDTAMKIAARDAYAQNIGKALEESNGNIDAALSKYSTSLEASKTDTLQALDDAAKGVKNDLTEAINSAKTRIEGGMKAMSQANTAAGNALAETERGPTGLSADQAAIEKGVAQTARQRTLEAAKKGTTVSAGEKVALGMARAEALGGAAQKAYSDWNKEKLNAATTVGNLGAATTTAAGNALQTVGNAETTKATTVANLALSGNTVAGNAAGNIWQAALSGNTRQFDQTRQAGQDVVTNAQNIDNRANIALENQALAGRSSLVSNESQERLTAGNALETGLMANQSQYDNARITAMQNEQSARANAMGQAGNAATGLANIATGEAAYARKVADAGAAGAKEGLVDLLKDWKPTKSGGEGSIGTPNINRGTGSDQTPGLTQEDPYSNDAYSE